MSEIELQGTVTLHKGTGAVFDAALTVTMITAEIGRILSANAGSISSALQGRLIYLENGVIYMQPENAIFCDDSGP